MRTKQTRELEAQEESWIYLLHAQNPPAERNAVATIASRGDGVGAPLLPGFDTVSGGVQDRSAMPMAGGAHLQRSYNQPSDVGSHYAAVAAAAAAAANSTSFEQNSYAASITSFDDSRLFNVNGPYARGPEFIMRRQPVMPPPTVATDKSETKPWVSANLPALSYASSSGSNSQFPFVSVGSKRPYEEKPQQSAKSLLVDLLPKSKRDVQLKQEAAPVISTQEDEIYQEDQEYGAASAGGASGKRNCFPKKCDFPMCKNSSRSRGFCYSHGGGRRCRIDGCSNGAVSRDLCKRHGGGRRCRINGCKSSSESGGLCYSHGGGRRCSLSWCSARAKKGGFCAVHLVDDKADRPATASSSSTMVVKQSNAVETLLSLAMDKKPETPRQASSNAHALASILN